jgi:hypothetical protein
MHFGREGKSFLDIFDEEYFHLIGSFENFEFENILFTTKMQSKKKG